MNLGIENKNVLITGGSRGIGREISIAFAKEGANVTIIARNKKDLKNTVQTLNANPGEHRYYEKDLLENGSVINLFPNILKKQSFDIIVHNLGGGLGIKDPLSDVNDWNKVWYFNIGIALEINSLIIPLMKTNKWGRIVHISSISALSGGPKIKPYGGSPPYSAAKAYLNNYVKSLGRELAIHNIIVTALMPGAILSQGKHWDRLQKENPKLVNDFLTNYYSLGRFGHAKEIAPFAVFLASEQASFASSAIINLDGGAI